MAWMMAREGQQCVPQLQLGFNAGHIRLAVGFLPKCLAWYLPRMPVALTAGAAPRGSFS